MKHLHTCSSCSTEDGPSSAAVAELVQMFELLKDTFMDSTVWPLARPKSVQMLNVSNNVRAVGLRCEFSSRLKGVVSLFNKVLEPPW